MSQEADNANSPAWLLTLLTSVAAFFLLVWHTTHYLPFIADDALISLRYADRLLAGHGLTWTDGQPVEGYSNLLWVLLAAGAGKLGLDLITAVRVLGYLSGAGVLSALAYAFPVTANGGRRARAGQGLLRRWLPLLVAQGGVVLAAPIAVWIVGGLESILVAALLTWAVVLLLRVAGENAWRARRALLPSLWLALLCVTRPDGPLFTAALCLAALLITRWRRDGWVFALSLLVLPLLFFLGQLIFRLTYYGEWLPNTALVKLVPTGQRIGEGAAYLARGLLALAPVSIVAAVFGLRELARRNSRAVAVLLGAPALLWCVYLIVIGGDIFPAWRHLVPLVGLMALSVGRLSVEVADRLAAIESRIVLRRAGIVAAGLILFAFYGVLQFTDDENRRAVSERWEWDGKQVGEMLATAFAGQQPLLATPVAGCLPYWSGLPTVDMLGLSDHYLPRHPPVDLGHGPLAHELGDGAYVLERNPDLVIFCSPYGRYRACYRSGVEMQEREAFFQRFTPVRFAPGDDPAVTCLVWINWQSERIGMRRQGSGWTIPGYLFERPGETVCRLDGSGQPVVTVDQENGAGMTNLLLPAGRYQVAIDASAPLRIAVLDSRDKTILAAGTAAPRQPLALDLTPDPELAARQPLEIDLIVSAVEAEPVSVHRVWIGAP